MDEISGHTVLGVRVRVVGDGNHYRFDFRTCETTTHRGMAHSKSGAIAKAYDILRELARTNFHGRSA